MHLWETGELLTLNCPQVGLEGAPHLLPEGSWDELLPVTALGRRGGRWKDGWTE